MVVEDRGPVLVVIRGDHRLNEIKLQNAARRAVRARPPRRRCASVFGAVPGYIGPVGARVEVLADEALRGLRGLVAGGNEPDIHLRGVEPGRDFEPTWGDVRRVEAGDRDAERRARSASSPPSRWGTSSSSARATRSPLGATYLDEQGVEQPIWMGSYGIGPARIVAAAIEQFADEHGISWPRCAGAVRRGARDPRQGGRGGTRRSPTGSTRSCATEGLDVLYDDRDASARGRSSPTPSCSAARCASRWASAAWRPARSRCRCAAGGRSASLPLEGAAAAAAELWRGLA